MKDITYNIINEYDIIGDITEEELINIFNEKLATLILYYEEKTKLERCNNKKYAI